MSGETTVGSIVGTLRLDAEQFQAEIDRVIAKVERLDGKNVDVQVNADGAARAEAELTGVAAAAEGVDRENVKVGRSSRDAGQDLGALGTAIIGLGPAIVPLAAGATALAVGFAGMGAAGVAAIFGIKNEMENATPVGVAFFYGLNDLKSAFTGLAATAASGMLAPFQGTVRDLVAAMPQLNLIISEFSGLTGNAARAVVGGLVAGFIQLEPLMRDVGGYVLDLTQRFQAMMSGSGLTSFGDYVRSVFPQVMTTLEHVVETAGRLVVAFAPLGGGVLSMLNAFATAINAIPLPVLTALATLGPAVFLGFRTWQALDPIVTALSAGLNKLAISEEAAAVGGHALTIAAGVIGVAITALMLVFAAQAESTRKTEQATNDYADALRASNGAIDESIQKIAAKKLQDEGALTAARNLGLSLVDVTLAATGNAAATDRVTTAIAAQRAELVATGAESTAWAGDVKVLTGALDINNVAVQGATAKNRDLTAATAVTAGATSQAGQALSALAGTYGVTVPVMQEVVSAQKSQAAAAELATAKMRYENDAAGVLKQSLDALSGKALSAAQAQQSFDSATVSLRNSTLGAKGAIDASKTAIEGNSAAAVSNRGSLLNLVTAANGVAEATAKQTGSTEAGRQALATMRSQILDNAAASGLNRAEVEKFISTVLKVPSSVPPTKLEADTADGLARIAAFQSAVNAIRGTSVTITTNRVDTYATTNKEVAPSPAADGAIFKAFAAGGFNGSGENHVAQIAPAGAMRVWAESETGGEAYIPLAPSKRARSTEIWAETGRLLGAAGGEGFDYQRFASTIVAAMSRVVLRPTISAGSFDLAMGAVV